ncbi:MAG: sugar ABC transporter ATP-binding protein [bacterium]|nr:sugar ABC transporter ATP-binding protein [bacterium]
MKSFEAKHFKKHFEGVVALRGADLKFEGAKICGLVGANGSGKTTFARLCAGLLEKDDGEFLIDKQPVAIDTPYDARKYGIVLAHQNLSLIPDLSVWQNINLGHERRLHKIFLDDKHAKELAGEILNDLIPNEIAINAKVGSLSPAQKQMVEIAKALSQNPKLLILDEPTAALEYFHVERLFKKVEELKKAHVSIIFISHRLWEITRICDLVCAFRNGESVGVVDFETAPRDEKMIVPLVVGENESVEFEKKVKLDLSEAEMCIELKNVSYKEKLKAIDFSAKKGEIVGIGGLHGQGQEELMMVLAGAFQATAGSMSLDNRKLLVKHPKDAIEKGIYLVPGDRLEEGLFPDHSIFDNVVFPRFCLKDDSLILNFTHLFSVTDEIIAKTELRTPHRKMIVGNLSGGNQQKVVFGRWLQFSPTVLLLNDPAKGIDIQAKRALYALTHELAERGTTVILYASSNDELIENCDRVLIMFEGKIVEEISHEDLSDETLIKSSLRVGVSA